MELVTGATGIVGIHLLLELAERGPVRAIHRPRSDRSVVDRVFRHYHPNADELLERIEWVEGDLLDVDSLEEAMTGITGIYHAAAIVSFDPSDAGAMQRNNVIGTANVVNAALEKGVQRLCHISSTATIGKGPLGVLRNESMAWSADKKTSAYALSKYEAELEVQRGIAEGLDAVIANPCVVIGPGLKGRSSMTLVERLERGTRFYPPGSNAIVDARDVAKGSIGLMAKGLTGERYLLVGENISYQRLFSLFSAAFGKPEPRQRLRSWMLEAAWRAERVRSLLTGSTPLVTEATASSAFTVRGYSPDKAQQLLGSTFISAEEAVKNVAKFQRSLH